MNVFEMMMGASRKISKPTPAPIEVIAPIIKKKLGRPPAIKKALDLTPLVTDLTVPKKRRVRVGYDSGDAKLRMEAALVVLIKARGKNCKRTAEVYGVNRKSLFSRFMESMKDQISGIK